MWTQAQFEREAGYHTAMAIAREMLALGIIDEADYRVLSTSLAKRFLPMIAALSP